MRVFILSNQLPRKVKIFLLLWGFGVDCCRLVRPARNCGQSREVDLGGVHDDVQQGADRRGHAPEAEDGHPTRDHGLLPSVGQDLEDQGEEDQEVQGEPDRVHALDHEQSLARGRAEQVGRDLGRQDVREVQNRGAGRSAPVGPGEIPYSAGFPAVHEHAQEHPEDRDRDRDHGVSPLRRQYNIA